MYIRVCRNLTIVAGRFTLLAICVFRLSAASLFGIDSSGDFWSISASTGTSTLIGASGLTGTTSLATNSSGTLYTVDGTLALDTINPNTGVGTTGPTVTGLTGSVSGLSFSRSGALYASVTSSTGPQSYLYTIDVRTGIATFVNEITSHDFVTDLAFSPTGKLYAWGLELGGLLLVNPGGSSTPVCAMPSCGPENLDGLSFSYETLYGVTTSELFPGNELLTIDLTTSATTEVGPLGAATDLRGIAFIPRATIPEPASVLLIGVGFAGLTYLARAKRKRV